ncbi:cytochrome c maturation protein CcmE [Pelagibacterales bacterium SAG-MED31]|nr:cytochrome c maturation protein CcmE [Pelagibacterales bacterium SAG-MED31]
MSLRFQRLVLILITLAMLGTASILILFNTKQNIVFFYTPSELIEKKISINNKLRIGGYVKESSFKKISLNKYQFKITDNNNDFLVFYEGILPDLFREGQGTVIEGFLNNKNNIIASKIYAKHDENYMPASIKKELEKNSQWKKKYK